MALAENIERGVRGERGFPACVDCRFALCLPYEIDASRLSGAEKNVYRRAVEFFTAGHDQFLDADSIDVDNCLFVRSALLSYPSARDPPLLVC